MPGSLLILALLAPPELDRAREAERAGNYTLMQEQAEAAASACRASGDTACQSAAVNLAANAHYYRGEYDAAKQGYMSIQIDDPTLVADSRATKQEASRAT